LHYKWDIFHHPHAKDALLHIFVLLVVSVNKFKFALKELTAL